MLKLITNRYFGTLTLTIVRAGSNFAMSLLLARLLGANDYGTVIFLTGIFLGLKQLTDLSTSSGFYTFISDGTRNYSLIFRYLAYHVLQLIIISLILLTLSDVIYAYIFIGLNRSLVIVAFWAIYSQYLFFVIIGHIADAIRKNIIHNLISCTCSLFNLIFVVYHFLFDITLSVYSVFMVALVFWTLSGLILYALCRPRSNFQGKRETAKSLIAEFWGYCRFLLVYTFFSSIQIFFDRWYLLKNGGNAEQAYFGLASQFSAVALLATSAYLKIFWKEVSVASHNKQRQAIFELYLISRKRLFTVTVILVFLFMPHTHDLIVLLVGDDYQDGYITILLMLFIPIHQSLVQMLSTMFLAMKNTRDHMFIGVMCSIIGILLTIILVTPSSYALPGFGLASEGIAVKLLVFKFQITLYNYF